MQSMVYPDGRQLVYDYGTSGSQCDLLSHVDTIVDGGMPVVSYAYSGSGSLVSTAYNQPGIEKTLALGSGSNPYAALDQFGRMVDLRWTKGTNDLVRFSYHYDRAGNRLSERNVIAPGGVNPAVDSLFGYDDLNRMTDFASGVLNPAGKAIASPESSQAFTLDQVGNFTSVTAGQGGTTVLAQTRSNNTVNEITSIGTTVGAAWATPDYDDAGNMSVIPQPADPSESFDATWDAWHRLVKLAHDGQTVASYAYDGANRRITRDLPGTATRHFYYSNATQVIDERIGASQNPAVQYLWNLGFVDDLVLRDRSTIDDGTFDERLYALTDLRFCVMAITDTNADIQERYSYSSLGVPSVYDAQFALQSSTNYDWEYRYTGRRQDLESGLLYFRARYYDPNTGEFISRDPLEYVDGMSQYRAYFVPGAVDPFGLLSCPEPPEVGDQYGVFYGGAAERVASGWTIGKLYGAYDSPQSHKMFITPTLAPTDKKITDAQSFVCSHFCLAQKHGSDFKLDIFGYSSGGILAVELSQRLDKEGCVCDGKKMNPVPIRFLGIIDPVHKAVPRGLRKYALLKPVNVTANAQMLRSLRTDTFLDSTTFPQENVFNMNTDLWSKTVNGQIKGYTHGEMGNVKKHPVLSGAVEVKLKQKATAAGVKFK